VIIIIIIVIIIIIIIIINVGAADASWYVQPFGHNTPTSQTDRQTDIMGRDNGANRLINGRPKTILKRYRSAIKAVLWIGKLGSGISTTWEKFASPFA